MRYKQALSVLSFSLAVLVGCYSLFVAVEAGRAFAATDEDTVEISLTVAATISISSPNNVSLGTITGTGVSNTSTADFNVITNNTSGYRFDVKASTSPALLCSSGGCAVASDSFDNYTPATVDTPEVWSIAATVSEFGISASGTDASSTFANGGVAGMKFYNLTTGNRQIGGRTSQTTGVTTSIVYHAEIGASKVQPTGVYTATTTALVTTL